MNVNKTESFFRRFEPMKADGFFMVLPLCSFFIVESLILKILQLNTLGNGKTVFDILKAWAPDFFVGLAVLLVFAILLSRENRALKSASAIVYYITMLVLLVLQTASHVYFATTGSHLSNSSISVWLEHTGETNTVIAGDLLGWKLAFLVAQVVVVLVFAFGRCIGPIRRKFAGKRAMSGGKARTVFLVIFFLAAILAFVPPLPGSRMALSRCVPTSIISDAMASLLLDDNGGDSEVNYHVEESVTELEFKENDSSVRPNIVIFIFESLNWKSSDVWTKGRNTTPFLKSIEDKSLLVENQYTIIPHTSKAIMPLLCGIYPYIGHAREETTADILPNRCMAHILRSQGYQTAFFQPAIEFEERGQLVKNMGFQKFVGLHDLPQNGFEKTSYFGSEDDIMIDPSLDWVDSIKDESPFFLTFLTLASHHNYVTPQSFDRVDFPEKDPDQRNYLNAVRYIDDFIAKVFSGFEKRGLVDDTVFLFIGDHGEAFGEHKRRQHDLIMWEEGLHVLSMLYSPKYIKPGVVKGARSHLDIVPTICDLLGLDLKRGQFAGTSLFSPPDEHRKLLHSCWFDRQCIALHEGLTKYIYHYNTQPMEVYNNSVDEFDEHDLAFTEPYNSETLDDIPKELLSWKRQINLEYATWKKSLKEGRISKKEPPIRNKVKAVFGNSVELVGYEVFADKVVPGSDVRVKYVFKCLDEMPKSMEFFVHIMKTSRSFTNADHIPVSGAYPLHAWKPGDYIVDEHYVHIPATWSGVNVKLGIGFWNKKTKERLAVTGDGIKVDENRLILTTIPVGQSPKNRSMDNDDIREKISKLVSFAPSQYERAVGAVFGDSVELVGVSLTRTDVKLAGTVELSYVFKALKDNLRGWRLVVSLEKEDGDEKIRDNHVPIGGLYPPSKWRTGEYILDKHMIHIDMYKSEVGTYNIWLGFQVGKQQQNVAGGEGYERDQNQRILLGKVTISEKTELQ